MQQAYEHEKAELEQFIVKLMLEYDGFLRSYFGKISHDIFSSEYSPIVFCILHYYKAKKTMLNKRILEELYFKKFIEDDIVRKKSIELVDKLYALEVPVQHLMTKFKDDIDKFFYERILINKLMASYVELVGPNGKGKDAAISIIKQALHVNFTESLGLDYFEDLEERAERLRNTDNKAITTGNTSLDELLGGGYRKKSLFVFAGPANSGKSLILNDAAVHLVQQGLNVLYVCLELSEDYTAQRTDSNFGSIEMNALNANPIDGITKVLAKYRAYKEQGKPLGVLWYKEYAPGAASCMDIMSLMRNLEAKKNIKFDIVIIDYLRLLNVAGKMYGDNMYTKMITICEEVRRMAIEENICILSASQTNRDSYGSSTPGMENISDSIGIAQTADALVTIGRDASLNSEDMMLLTVAKSRFSKNGSSVTVKVDYKFMRLIDMGKTVKHSAAVTKKINKITADKSDFKKEMETEPLISEDPKKEPDFELRI